MADYKKQLLKISDLHGCGEGAVRSFIERTFIEDFSKGNVVEGKSIIAEFADYGFDNVLKVFADRKMDFKSLKSVETGELLEGTVLDNCLSQLKGYDPDCLNFIIKAGGYTKTDLAKSFMKLCQLHQETIKENVQKVNCLHLDSAFDILLQNGLDLNEIVDGRIAFHSLCELYSFAKKNDSSSCYREMLENSMQRMLDNDADVNAVDDFGKTAFSFNDMEMKSRFVRHHRVKEEKRMLDLFMIVGSLLDKLEDNEHKPLVEAHIQTIKRDMASYAKRARFDSFRQK